MSCCGCKTSSPRDILEEIEASPLKRWRLYGEFPWRLLAQLVSLAAVLVHIWLVVLVRSSSSRAFDRNWSHLLLGSGSSFLKPGDADPGLGFRYDAEDGARDNFVEYSGEQCANDLQGLIRSYYDLPWRSVDELAVANNSLPSGEAQEIPLPLFWYSTTDDKAWSARVRTPDDLGPLSPKSSADQKALNEFFGRVKEMRLSLQLESRSPQQWQLMGNSCVRWSYDFVFKHRGEGPIHASVDIGDESICRKEQGGLAVLSRSPYFASLCTLLVLSLLHASLAIGRVLKGRRLWIILRELHRCRGTVVGRGGRVLRFVASPINEEEAPERNVQLRPVPKGSVTWESVRWNDKLALLNIWVLLSIVGDALQVLFCAIQLIYAATESLTARNSDSVDFLLAAGFTFSMFGYYEYVEYSFVNFLFVQVGKAARSEVFKTIFGSAPVFLGYTVLGTVLYGDSLSRFGTIQNSAITLLAVLIGDEVRPTFVDICSVQVPAWISCAYVTSFIFIFLFIVNRVFLAIVELAFITNGLWLLESVNKKKKRNLDSRAVLRAATQNLSTVDMVNVVAGSDGDDSSSSSSCSDGGGGCGEAEVEEDEKEVDEEIGLGTEFEPRILMPMSEEFGDEAMSPEFNQASPPWEPSSPSGASVSSGSRHVGAPPPWRCRSDGSLQNEQGEQGSKGCSDCHSLCRICQNDFEYKVRRDIVSS